MARISPAPYRSETVSPPGATIRDMLKDFNMSQAELARRMGRPANKVNQIIHGKRAITAETALELQNVLGLPAEFWLRREQNYRLAISERRQITQQEAEAEIIKKFPYAEMARFGWVEKHTTQIEKFRALLAYFSVATGKQLGNIRTLAPAFGKSQLAFRKSKLKEANPLALAAWLRKGVLESNRIQTQAFNRRMTQSRLGELRALTTVAPRHLESQLQRLGAELGIAVVFVPHLPKSYVGGAAYWLEDKPVIQLSYRYKWTDHIWFNFFHELGHILLHSQKKKTWLDDFTDTPEEHEIEANEFAADTLIPPAAFEQLTHTAAYREERVIRRFARQIEIAPGIVVGRLQREDLLPRTHLYKLKEKLEP